MTITRDNLKIMKPAQLGTSDDAGGLRTKNPVTSGMINDILQPIADIDHAQSAIDIVKFFPSVDTADTSTLLKGHVFVGSPPTDPLVSMMLVEADALTDASVMTDMREILESSVTAGVLINEGVRGFLPNQNSFDRAYLESTYMFNGKEYRKITRLTVGQVICINTEYTGVESVLWPRINHFCKVTSVDGDIIFEPPLPIATPDYDVDVNGQTRCTTIRRATEVSPLTFHGVTKLTAIADGVQLNVGATEQSLIPTLEGVKRHIGLTTNSGGESDGTEITLKSLSQLSTSSQSYSFTVNDYLDPLEGVLGNTVKVTYTSNGTAMNESDAVVTVTSGDITVILSNKADVGTNVTIGYVSNIEYGHYDSASTVLGAGESVVKGSLYGEYHVVAGNAWLKLYEQNGVLYKSYRYDLDNRFGILNYDTGVTTFTNAAEIDDVRFTALYRKSIQTTSATFSIAISEPILDSFYVQVETTQGSLISGSADSNGAVTGTGVSGTVSGTLVSLTFTSDVNLSTLLYNVDEIIRLTPPADIYKLNPLRIPNNGRVAIFREWGTVMIQHSQFQAVTTPTAGDKMNVRANTSFVQITDKDGKSLWTPTDDHYEVNLETGVVTIKSDFTGFTAPFVLTDTVGELALTASVDSNTSMTVASALTRAYPIGSTVSSVQNLGDMQARAANVRDMSSWSDNWDVDGTPVDANLNVIDFPIEVSNADAINEEWVLVFTSATAFRFVGRNVGQVATGDTLNDFSPLNSTTQRPFLTIRAGAFGSGGFNAGEAVRFNTVAASSPVMAVRSVQTGHSQITTDKTTIAFRGNGM